MLLSIMRRSKSAAWIGITAALIFPILAYLVRLIMGSQFTGYPFLTFFLATVLVAILAKRRWAWFSAFWSALLATRLVIEPGAGIIPLGASTWLGLIIFLVVSGMMITLVQSLTNNILALEDAKAELLKLKAKLEERVDEVLADRKFFADIVEGTDAFVQAVDHHFRWLAINNAAATEFESIYGVRPKVGDSMIELLAEMPEHQNAVQSVWSRALSGEQFVETNEFGDPRLNRRCYEMKFNVLTDSKGSQIGAYQFGYDVTNRVNEQKRLANAEQARQDADALYRAYFENSPDALFVIRVDDGSRFIVEELNPAHEYSVGYKSIDVRGKSIEEFLPADVARQVTAAYQHVVETGKAYQYNEDFDLHGSTKHWETSLFPVFDSTGDIERIIGTSRDITRRLLAEEALRQSQKMEAMGQLTGGVAHDFNNLLTPIVGSLDMLQRQGLGNEREQRLIAGAAQSAERAKTLVQRLLAFARRQPLQSVPVDVANLVSGMADLISSTTGPQINIVVDAREDLPPAKADPNQLEMALLNLSVNARDAMPDGGTLRISACEEIVGTGHPAGLQPGKFVKISVSDTGSGMDETTRSRAIEPFYSTKGIGKGTGLGLSMVHGLASQLNGALTIQSQLKVGTEIGLWLPVSHDTPTETFIASDITSPNSERGTALLVDDEELVRMSTADMLTDLGYQVKEASSGEEAMRLINAGAKIDILITDHLMPGMTGTELAHAVWAKSPDLTVLLVSGYAEHKGIDPTLPRLVKPFRKSELEAVLAEI